MTFNQMLHGFLNLIVALIDLILGAFAAMDFWLRGVMSHMGVPTTLQTAVLVVLGIVFFVGAIRLLGGVLRILLIVFVVLFLLHLLSYVPGMHHVSSRAASIQTYQTVRYTG